MGHSAPSHISKIVPSTVHSGPPEEARTPREGGDPGDHRPPNHIPKTVLSIVHVGPAPYLHLHRAPRRLSDAEGGDAGARGLVDGALPLLGPGIALLPYDLAKRLVVMKEITDLR